MIKKAITVSCVTASFATIALFLPLPVLISGVVTLLILVLGGHFIGQYASQKAGAVRLGGFVGVVVGLMTFAAFGAAYAGTRTLATSSAEPVLIITDMTYVMLWAMVIVFGLFGALGALLSRQTKEPPPTITDGRLADVISTRFLLTSTLILLMTASVAAPLYDNVGPSVFNWPFGSAFALFFIILLWKFLHGRSLGFTQQARVNLIIVAVVPVLVVIIMGVIFWRTRIPTVWVTLLALPISLLAFRQYNELRDAHPSESMPDFIAKESVLMTAFCGGATFAVPALMIVPLTLNLRYVIDPTTNLFLMQAGVAYAIFLLGGFSIVFGPWLVQTIKKAES